jgi:four helix bundle protein
MIRNHRKLRTFQEADALVLEVYRVTNDMPLSERFGLQAQVRRAAVSVATNIVEGSARPSTAEYVRFLQIASASARETAYLLDLAGRLKVLAARHAAPLVDRFDRLQAMLFRMVEGLQRSS